VLEHLSQWTAAGWLSRRAQYDLVIVDGPATGHAVRLLRTPRQLAALVPRGPLSSTVGRLTKLLEDPEHTGVLLVAIPEEMAVSETLETHAAVDDLGIAVARPVLNRVWPRRFSGTEADAIAALRKAGDDPLLAAASLEINFRREAERHLARLRRGFGIAPLSLHEVCRPSVDAAALAELGRTLERGLFDHPA
jgi:anion-transporting  ArsA/GET3 family ATPase